jgi:hypothetical protein
VTRRQYRFASATALLIATIVFFILPAALDLDYFIPVILALVCLFSALAMFFTGASET